MVKENNDAMGTLLRIQKLEAALKKALRMDYFELNQALVKLKRASETEKSKERFQNDLESLDKRIHASIRKKFKRKQNVPSMTWETDLPILARKDDIIDSIRKNQVTIISGETGSGKTTQIPKFCLLAGRGISGRIGCTQPRRIAALSVANRIAEEIGEEIGKSVGYKIRFNERTSEHGYIKIMTDGILLAEAHSDPMLNEYDTIIIDEAHERSLNIDFILGILKKLVHRRHDLRLIITSATLDTEKFSKAFDDAPIIEVSGRMFPVDVKYFQQVANIRTDEEQTYVEMAGQIAFNVVMEASGDGDILIFMPTEQDIRETCEILEGKFKAYRLDMKVFILPLYGRLSAQDQAKIFKPSPKRKIIVSTNVAETSLTIPGIQFVIDTGLARIPQYSPRTRTNALPIVPISRSSADQRKGRSGRVRNGVCIRLYSEADYLERPLFTPPEILRSNLAEVILRMIALDIGDVSQFPFIDKPSDKSIRDGFDVLNELGAITPETTGKRHRSRYQLTDDGKLMASIPLDPRLSRMLIEAWKQGCIQEMTVIAAALSIQDPRERPAEKQAEADQSHSLFSHPDSDFLTILNLWNLYQKTRKELNGTNKIKRFCRDRYLSFLRMREWEDIHNQIHDILHEWNSSRSEVANGTAPIPQPARIDASSDQKESDRYEPIHKSILSGFLSNIAQKKESKMFRAAKDRDVMIFPGSAVFKQPGDWIVSAEMVETSRLFARTVANVRPNWIEEMGKPLCKYSWSDPHWERNRGEVMAYEQASLFGLILVGNRVVPYGSINPDEASDIFILNALVREDIKKPFPFMDHNRKLMEEVIDIENKIRRRDLLITEQDTFQFYKLRLENIYSIRGLEKIIRQKNGDAFLRMKKKDLFQYRPDQTELSNYPDTIRLGDQCLPCTYHFEPGSPKDGITVQVPSIHLHSLTADSLDWIIPGLFREKVDALIRGLPKEYRKKLLPLNSTIDIIINEMPQDDHALISSLGKFMYQRFGVDIPSTAWNLEALADYLKLRILVTDTNGKELASGRDKSILNQHLPKTSYSDSFKAAKKKWERQGITEWDFGDLPDQFELTGEPNESWIVYPGLEPNENSVSLRLFQSPNRAAESHVRGVRLLLSLYLAKDLKFLRKSITLTGKMKSYADYFGGAKKLESIIYDTMIDDLFLKNIRSESVFHSYRKQAADKLLQAGNEKLHFVSRVTEAYHQARSTFYDLEVSNPDARPFLEELRTELSRLIPDNFLTLYSADRLGHLERYIRAIMLRGQRALLNFEKYTVRSRSLEAYTGKLESFLKQLSVHASPEKRTALEELFWLIEEFKVSLFAQELKTAIPVSQKRLDEKIKEIERMI